MKICPLPGKSHKLVLCYCETQREKGGREWSGRRVSEQGLAVSRDKATSWTLDKDRRDNRGQGGWATKQKDPEPQRQDRELFEDLNWILVFFLCQYLAGLLNEWLNQWLNTCNYVSLSQIGTKPIMPPPYEFSMSSLRSLEPVKMMVSISIFWHILFHKLSNGEKKKCTRPYTQCVRALSLSHVQLFKIQWTLAYQAYIQCLGIHV